MVTLRPARVIRVLTVATPPITPAAPVTAADKRTTSHRRKASSGGTPSRTESAQLRERILVGATELLLSEGYGPTSIEAVARGAGISKRTFYHRFADKAALFAAVLHRIIEKVRPPADVPLLEGATLHEILRRLAGLFLRAALSPDAIALQRLVTAESARFPELTRAVHSEGWAQQATTMIAALLTRSMEDPQFTHQAAEFAAEQFLHTVVALPQRRAIGLGDAIRPEELDAWADNGKRSGKSSSDFAGIA